MPSSGVVLADRDELRPVLSYSVRWHLHHRAPGDIVSKCRPLTARGGHLLNRHQSHMKNSCVAWMTYPRVQRVNGIAIKLPSVHRQVSNGTVHCGGSTTLLRQPRHAVFTFGIAQSTPLQRSTVCPTRAIFLAAKHLSLLPRASQDTTKGDAGRRRLRARQRRSKRRPSNWLNSFGTLLSWWHTRGRGCQLRLVCYAWQRTIIEIWHQKLHYPVAPGVGESKRNISIFICHFAVSVAQACLSLDCEEITGDLYFFETTPATELWRGTRVRMDHILQLSLSRQVLMVC